MTEDHLEKTLKQARPTDVRLDGNREAIRALLRRTTERKQRNGHPALRPFFAVGVTVGAVLGAVFVLTVRDADASREVTSDLGGAWRTYTDNREDGHTVIWPPSSEGGRNNFVKSAPGYGGTGYAVRFKGSIDGGTGPGFIGVSTFLGPQCADETCAGVDLRGYQKIRFKMRGFVQGGPLLLVVSGPDSKTAAVENEPGSPREYETDITRFVSDTWHTVTLDLRDDFASAAEGAADARSNMDSVLSDTRQVKWHVRGAEKASVDVWIDNLEFY